MFDAPDDESPAGDRDGDDCPTCHGWGVCPVCDGPGTIYGKQCHGCAGTGDCPECDRGEE